MKKKTPEKREEKVQRTSKKKLTYAIILFSLIVLVGFSLYMMFLHSSSDEGFSFKAAIIDQLGITYKNDTFKDTATTMLKQAGYATVDYYDYKKVTVEFYRSLPQRDYGLIILRTHSGTTKDKDVCLFTSEPNTTQYGYSLVLSYLNETGKWYYGIPPKFIEFNMDGKFRNTIFIVTGCDSAKYPSMANALQNKSAKAYIGWNGPLRADLADNTTIYLLKTLLENQTIKEAVSIVNSKISGNANYGNSRLDYYPKSSSVENYVIPKVKNKALAVRKFTPILLGKAGFSVSRSVSKQLHEVDPAKRRLKS